MIARPALLVILLTLGGCSSTESAQPSPSTHAVTAATCRLPVVIRRFDSKTGTWSPDATSFLNYPSGDLAPSGGAGVRYDARSERWLPNGIPTPDGAAYVYGDDAGAVHLVDLDSGLDRVIVAPAWRPVGFAGGRLYLAQRRTVSFEGSTGFGDGGLGWVDLAGGRPALVTTHSGFWWISALGGWTLDRADGLQQAPDRVLHVDLATGAVETWLTSVPEVTLAGFDAEGHPFATSEVEPIRVLLITAKSTAEEVYSGPRDAGWPDFPSYSDGSNVWFSGMSIKDPTFEAPVWMYSPGKPSGLGLRPSMAVPGAQVSVAGPCR